MFTKASTVIVLLLLSQLRLTIATDTRVKTKKGVLGVPCSNRSAWDYINIPDSVIQLAKQFKETPIPSWSDEEYLMYYTSGDRSGQRMMWARQDRLPYLILAECAAHDGSFLEIIEADLLSLATQRSWVLPSTDVGLTYFNGTQYFVELNSAAMVGTGYCVSFAFSLIYVYIVALVVNALCFLSHFGQAANFGLAIHLIGDMLNETVKNVVIDALITRVFEPLNSTLQGDGIRMWWIKEDTNWNSVCWAGVMIAVFCVVDSATDRSFFASRAIEYSQGYLDSFQDDGFASEGTGYYNYGFTNYALLRQVLYEGTDGAHDAYEHPKAGKAALFAKEFGMSRKSVANFGDSHYDTVFRRDLVSVIDRSFESSIVNTPLFQIEDVEIKPRAALRGNRKTLLKVPNHKETLNLPWYMLELFHQNIPRVQTVTTNGMNDLRRFYNESGVLVARPNGLNDGLGLAATFKLGGNIGTHSHNDIGSYVISVNSVQLTGDPGGPLFYDADTFNNKRYLSPLMNSYGHPLPVINGNLQEQATSVLRRQLEKPFIVYTNFTNSTDTIVFNLTNAYDEPLLKELIREQIFDRESNRIIITDSVRFSEPCMFEDALITQKNWNFSGNSSGYFFDDSFNTLNVEINSTAPFIMNSTNLSDYKVNFERIGVYILQPIISASVTFEFTCDTVDS